MWRLGIVGLVMGLVAVLGVGTAVASEERFGFEGDFEGWTPASDGRAAGWDVTRSAERPRSGSYAVKMVINGGNDDGTVWVQRPCDAELGGTVRVTVSFWLWVQGASTFNAWPVVAYAGDRMPSVEADFAKIARSDRAGWQRYEYTTTVNAFSGFVWVAVGLSVTWEIVRTSFLDDITVTIEPPF